MAAEINGNQQRNAIYYYNLQEVLVHSPFPRDQGVKEEMHREPYLFAYSITILL